ERTFRLQRNFVQDFTLEQFEGEIVVLHPQGKNETNKQIVHSRIRNAHRTITLQCNFVQNFTLEQFEREIDVLHPQGKKETNKQIVHSRIHSADRSLGSAIKPKGGNDIGSCKLHDAH